MPRKARIFLKDNCAYVYVQAIPNELLFKELNDYELMLEFIKKNSTLHDINILNTTLLESSFYLILKGKTSLSISSFMQALGRNYVGYFNKKYERTGSLWLSRYKTSLIQESVYLKDVESFLEYKKRKNYKKEKELLSKPNFSYINECFLKQNIIATEEFIKDLEKKLAIPLLNKRKGRPKTIRNIMYKKLVPLNKEKHKDLRISKLDNIDFAKQSKSFPILLNEISKFYLLFPLVFTNDENPQIIALTTLNNINISITKNGKFAAPYLPFYFAKYPFAFATIKDKPDQRIVAIDEEAKNVSYDAGEPLFDEELQQTDFLKNAISFLTSYEELAIKTFSLTKLIVDADILEEREVSLGEGEEKEVLIKGFKVISRDKLNALSDETLATWVRSGIITLIDYHLKSLDNLETLMNKTFLENSEEGR